MTTRSFLLAATRSGAGKTTVTLGVMAALVRRGLTVQPFKCGPDFIDPTLHRMVTGRTSYTIDLQMMGAAVCRALFAGTSGAADLAVLEGVMGLFDGGEASTAAIAKALGVPVCLIIDAKSSAESCAAVLKGFEAFDPQIRLIGVIFNRIGSPRHRELIETAVRKHCRCPIIGWLPRDERFAIAERHLGLQMASEQPLDKQALDCLADTVRDGLDLDLLIDSGVPVPARLEKTGGRVKKRRQSRLRIGLAEDQAFCFYYQQNLDLLTAAGFDLVPFSPLSDHELPEDIDVFYFGGGYPELHAAALSANDAMLAAVRSAHLRGTPIYAECGGFMYLCRELVDTRGHRFPMARIFPFITSMGTRLRRLGYRTVVLQDDCLLGRRGDRLYGHEFHYSDIAGAAAASDDMDAPVTRYLLDNNSFEGYSCGSTLGSYIHLHFGRTPTVCNHLRRHCENNRP